MKYTLSLILIVLLFYSCKDTFSDKDKRNENWVWWTDAKTGKSSWIPVNDGSMPVMNGKYTSFYFNGNIRHKGKLINGKDNDTVFCYDINGHPEEYIIDKEDTIEYFYHNGPIKMVDAEGTLSAEGIVENHTYRPKWVNYYKNGKPQNLRNLIRDTGWITLYYDNGKVEDSFYYEGKHGLHIKHWYITGQLAESSEFKNGNYNGVRKEYYFNGRLKYLDYVVNDKFEGKSTKWFEDGKINEVSNYKNGVLNGQQEVYYENGQLHWIGSCTDGKFNGELKKYDEKGKLIADYILKDGIRIEDKSNIVPK
ncbi:MAG TPA: toxin-antitoxin system YwqK family antitoxin [Mucilaginibacter sp.]|nr:toxin-antitoxin system YwqK family antitoxin [Mucilaginibacter sp.]